MAIKPIGIKHIDATPAKHEDIEYYKRERREFLIFFVILISCLAALTILVFFAYDWAEKMHYENHTVDMLRKGLK